MTTEPKCLLGWCLPGCVPWPCTGHQWPRRGCNECSVDHAPGCPNAECPCKAGEPKQGSEEPIEPVTELEAEKSTSKILRDLLAKAEAERDEARADSLRAELAAAREEIAKLRLFLQSWCRPKDLLAVKGAENCRNEGRKGEA